MERVYNFSAGPAVLPEDVLREAAEEMLNYKGSGMSVMEMSHRSKTYQAIIEEAEKDPSRPTKPEYSTIYTTCPNPKCISNHEYVERVEFHEKTAEDHAYSCEYCDRVITI